LPSKTPGTTHLHDDAKPGFSLAEITQRKKLRGGQHLTLQQPESDGGISFKEITELRHHFLNLTDCSAATDALMAKVWGTNTMFLSEINLWISETAC
jgi:hypothetical protein